MKTTPPPHSSHTKAACNARRFGATIKTKKCTRQSLDVYQLSLKFHLGVMTLLPQRGSPTLRDQLERASIILNIAEGTGHLQR